MDLFYTDDNRSPIANHPLDDPGFHRIATQFGQIMLDQIMRPDWEGVWCALYPKGDICTYRIEPTPAPLDQPGLTTTNEAFLSLALKLYSHLRELWWGIPFTCLTVSVTGEGKREWQLTIVVDGGDTPRGRLTNGKPLGILYRTPAARKQKADDGERRSTGLTGETNVKVRCRKCRALNNETARFCDQCGSSLEE